MSSKKLQRIWCTDREKAQLVDYLKNTIRGDTGDSSDTSVSVTPESPVDIETKLDQILERVNCVPLGRVYQQMLRQAIFLWQYETNKRADPANEGTPQAKPLEDFIAWCKTEIKQWAPNEDSIADFVDQLRIKE